MSSREVIYVGDIDIDLDAGTVAVHQFMVEQYTTDYWRAETFVMAAARVARDHSQSRTHREYVIRQMFAAEFGWTS